MEPRSTNPTLLVGLGEFGRAVVGRVVPAATEPEGEPFADLVPVADAEPSAPLVALRVSLDEEEVDGDVLRADGEDAERAIVDAVIERSRALLDLARFVEGRRPTDARGPHLDVFVICDLSDPNAGAIVARVVESLGVRLRREFRPILRAGHGALSICPMLFAPRSGTTHDSIVPALRALADLSRHAELDRRPQARIYVVEDQSGKYLLSRAEIQRSFAAFLHLLLGSELRDDRGMRELVERSPEERGGPFATFCCATLEVDARALARLMVLELSREVLDRYEPGLLPLSEISNAAQPLVPERVTVEAELWSEGEHGSLETYLEPPAIEVPAIVEGDSPEDITERKLGRIWEMQAEKAIATFRDEVERFKMDRLANRIEKNGTALAARIDEAALARLRDEIVASPRGPSRALEVARYAATRARGFVDATAREIASPSLREFPPSPVARALAAVHEAAAARPRRERIRWFTALAVVLATPLLAGLVHAGARVFVGGIPWWASGGIGLAAAVAMFPYSLWRHVRRHANWVEAARADLHQTVQGHLRHDVVDYFRRRLEYTRLLWTHRIYRELADRLSAVVAQLEAADAALAEAERRLVAESHDLHARSGGAETGILYRTVLHRELVRAHYEHVRPGDPAAIASRYQAGVVGDRDPLDAPWADCDAVIAYCEKELATALRVSPFGDDRSPIAPRVREALREYLCQLSLSLSPPLEVVEAATEDARPATGVLVVPPEAEAIVREIIASEDVAGHWLVRGASGDRSRIHLLLERDELGIEALACAREQARGKA